MWHHTSTMCPHTTIYVSAYSYYVACCYYYMCPHTPTMWHVATTICVRITLYIRVSSSDYYGCRSTRGILFLHPYCIKKKITACGIVLLPYTCPYIANIHVSSSYCYTWHPLPSSAAYYTLRRSCGEKTVIKKTSGKKRN